MQRRAGGQAENGVVSVCEKHKKRMQNLPKNGRFNGGVL